MKIPNRLHILIIATMLVLASVQMCFAADGGMVYADNLNLELKTIDGDTIQTAETGRPKIVIFFNTTCSHCDNMLADMKSASLNIADVDVIMAESHDADAATTAAYAEGKNIDGLTWCYDAKEACWRYLYTCGYSNKITVKPVVFYISADDKIMGYTYSYENIFDSAKKYGINLIATETHDHSWQKQSTPAAYCRKGFSYRQCELCGAIKGVRTTAGLGPSSVTISGISRGKTALTIKWRKLSAEKLEKVRGYQIRYSRNAKMNNAKVVNIEDNSLTATKLSGLKSGKKYYVQIRTYAQTGSPDDSTYEFRINQWYYSAWSKARAVTLR